MEADKEAKEFLADVDPIHGHGHELYEEENESLQQSGSGTPNEQPAKQPIKMPPLLAALPRKPAPDVISKGEYLQKQTEENPQSLDRHKKDVKATLAALGASLGR